MSEFKRCSKCRIFCVKSNFHKDNKRRDGVQGICILCTQQHHINRKEQRNALERRKRKTDFTFISICNIRTRSNKAIKSQNIEKLIKQLIY